MREGHVALSEANISVKGSMSCFYCTLKGEFTTYAVLLQIVFAQS